MTWFKRTLSSARERFARFKIAHRAQRVSTREGMYMRQPCSIDHLQIPISSQEAAAALTPTLSDQALHTGQDAISIALTAIHKVPATLTITTEAANVCKFSHGAGLLVYINGALISAACVALKVNIATLKFVKQLPLEEMGTIGACLGAAFADAGSLVDVSWAEVGSETERDWREAERHWEVFPGGPYEAIQLDEHDREAHVWRSVRCDPSTAPSTGVTSRTTMAEVGSTTLPYYSYFSSYASIPSKDEAAPVTWSPSESNGHDTSSDEFDAPPGWRNVDDDAEWNSTAGEMFEMDSFF